MVVVVVVGVVVAVEAYELAFDNWEEEYSGVLEYIRRAADLSRYSSD